MYHLYIITGILFLISFSANRQKTFKAVNIAFQRFRTILPAFLLMLVLISIVLFLLPEETIVRYLGGQNIWTGVLIASFFGSLTAMPGFVAFPLSGILLKQGVAYMVLSAFTTTLMMVGILTFPVEKQFLGTKVTVMRNAISFAIALVVAFVTGIFFGEIF